VMLATAYRYRATLWTQDSDFEGLQVARYLNAVKPRARAGC
jgi:predicted nucleic acid-binding protein